MLNPFIIYGKYPFKIPWRVRIFNLVRYFFRLPLLEKFLVELIPSNPGWKKLVPPVYFYHEGSIRNAERDGIRFRLDLSKLLDRSIFFYILFEEGWHNLFKIVRKDFTVVDVGANIGFLTLNFAKRCPSGKVIAFEPDSQSFKNLQTNVLLNSFKNIELHQLALGSRVENRLLYKLHIHNPGANRILFPTEALEHSDHEQVQVQKLDELTFVQSQQRIDLIKIDVEGFEMFVLEGARKTIDQFNPILCIELADENLRTQGFSARELIEYVRGLNYDVVDAKTMQPIDELKQLYQTDILCFPKS